MSLKNIELKKFKKKIRRGKIAEQTEIDSIFAKIKKKKDPVKTIPKSIDLSDDFFDSKGINNNKKLKTEDGLNVYTEEELGLDKNRLKQETPLCPFDCDCCF